MIELFYNKMPELLLCVNCLPDNPTPHSLHHFFRHIESVDSTTEQVPEGLLRQERTPINVLSHSYWSIILTAF